jgi:hypothetical protein
MENAITQRNDPHPTFETGDFAMRSLTELKRSATESCALRGHEIEWAAPWHGETKSIQRGKCRRCDMVVDINTNPLPNGIEIGGEAVALNCPRTRPTVVLPVDSLAHMSIDNPNSSGQGFCPFHSHNPYHDTLKDHGWEYSHTTLINRGDGTQYAIHTYKFPNTQWVVGVNCTPGWPVHTHQLGSHRGITRYGHGFRQYLHRKTLVLTRDARRVAKGRCIKL